MTELSIAETAETFHTYRINVWNAFIKNIPSDWFNRNSKGGKKRMKNNVRVQSEKKDMYDNFDCLFSSILFNCCQFSCYTPHQETYCSYQPNPNTPTGVYPSKNNEQQQQLHNENYKNQSPAGPTDECTKSKSQCDDTIVCSPNEVNMTSSTSNWMGHVIQFNDTIVLKDMIIPGSHHSGSYSIPNFRLFSAIAKTQNLSIKQQLNAGIRYLDIRVAPTTKTETSYQTSMLLNTESNSDYNTIIPLSHLSVWHGTIEGLCTLETVLYDIHEFCSIHTSECIIIEFVPEHGHILTTEQKRLCLSTIMSILDTSHIIPASKMKDCITTIPLKSVIETDFNDTIIQKLKQPNLGSEILEKYKYRNKSKLILLLHDRFFENDFTINDMMNHREYFNLSSYYVANKWHNLHNNIPLLFQKNVAHLNRYQQFPYFICNQFIITPNIHSVKDIICFLFGIHSLRPISWSCQMYQTDQLEKLLASSIKKSDDVQFLNEREWNIILLDFIDLCPDIIDFMISLNFHNSRIEETENDAVVSSSSESVISNRKDSITKSVPNPPNETTMVNSNEVDVNVSIPIKTTDVSDSIDTSTIEKDNQTESVTIIDVSLLPDNQMNVSDIIKNTNTNEEIDEISSGINANLPRSISQRELIILDDISDPINHTSNEEYDQALSEMMTDATSSILDNKIIDLTTDEYSETIHNKYTDDEYVAQSTTINDECLLLPNHEMAPSKTDVLHIAINEISNETEDHISSSMVTDAILHPDDNTTKTNTTEPPASASAVNSTITTDVSDVLSKPLSDVDVVPDNQTTINCTVNEKTKLRQFFQIHTAVIELNETITAKEIVHVETEDSTPPLPPSSPRPSRPLRKILPTDAINQQIYRDCVLYVPNPIQEWNIPSIKQDKKNSETKKFFEVKTILTLTIGYSLVDRITRKATNYVATIPLSSMSVNSTKYSTWPIIFCPYYCINHGSFNVTLTEDELDSGVIVHGARKYMNTGCPSPSTKGNNISTKNTDGGQEYNILDETTDAMKSKDNYGSKLSCTRNQNQSIGDRTICQYQLVAEKVVKLLIFPSSSLK